MAEGIANGNAHSVNVDNVISNLQSSLQSINALLQKIREHRTARYFFEVELHLEVDQLPLYCALLEFPTAPLSGFVERALKELRVENNYSLHCTAPRGGAAHTTVMSNLQVPDPLTIHTHIHTSLLSSPQKVIVSSKDGSVGSTIDGVCK
jgi:hypothetical protein